jgi:hypothetical protein
MPSTFFAQMRTLAATMAAITVLTTALFAHALATAGNVPAPTIAASR